MLATHIIGKKRDGLALTPEEIESFTQGLASGSWSDAQAAALAMAILLRGMSSAETVALTQAMARSGEMLDWSSESLNGPRLDKHSTGGVGDKVSLVLAPMIAACGGVVPMISGRGLGHTGGTLDKLQALPGYCITPDRSTLLATLRGAGCAIVGASAQLAPADRRLYAIRDVTATVASLPLITASILSKKLAAGLQGLVLDVKVGSGALMHELADARALANSLVAVARAAGLPAVALISDMNQVLGSTAGNALEVQEAIDFLKCKAQDLRLLEVTLALGAELLCCGGLCADTTTARRQLQAVLASGAAAERFARMVALLGGPADVLQQATLPQAPVQRDVLATHSGTLQAMDVRAIGMAVVALGGGRTQASDAVDARVGLSHCLPLGSSVQAGQALVRVHAASVSAADAAASAVLVALTVSEQSAAHHPLVVERIV